MTTIELPVVLLGDSSLSGEGLGDHEHDKIWAHRALGEIAKRAGVTLPIDNRAQSGARLDSLGAQLDNLSALSPSIALLAVGTNDVTGLRRSKALVGYRARYRQLLDLVGSEVPVIVAAGVGDLSRSPRFDHDLRIRPLRGLAKLASWYANRQVEKAVDGYRRAGGRVLLIRSGAVDDELAAGRQWYFSSDRFHPNAQGHEVWADLARPTLERAVDSARAGLRPADDHAFVRTRLGQAKILRAGASEETKAVVLIPDAPNVVEHYHELIASIDKMWQEGPLPRWRILVIEMPGLGESRSSGFDFSLRSGAEWIESVLDAEGVEQAIIATCCINGLWAAKAAQIDHDERIRALVLGQTLDLAATKQWGTDTIDWWLRWPIIGDLAMRWGWRWVTRPWYTKALADGEQIERYDRLATAALRRGAGWELAPLYRAIQREEVDPLKHVLKKKKKVVVKRLWSSGDGTNPLPPCTDSSGVINAGHFPDLEAPATFANAIGQAQEDVASRAANPVE